MDALLDQYKGQKQEGGANIRLGVFSLILERYQWGIGALCDFTNCWSHTADSAAVCPGKRWNKQKSKGWIFSFEFCVKWNLLKDVMFWYRTSIFVIMFSEAHSVANCRVAHLLWLWCQPEISNLQPLLSKHHAKMQKSTVFLGTACVHILFDILHFFVRFSTTICDFSSFM